MQVVAREGAVCQRVQGVGRQGVQLEVREQGGEGVHPQAGCSLHQGSTHQPDQPGGLNVSGCEYIEMTLKVSYVLSPVGGPARSPDPPWHV